MCLDKPLYTAAGIKATIRAVLCGQGFSDGRDFFLREAEFGTRYVILDLTWLSMITEDLLLQCSEAHGKDWGVVIGAFDPEQNDLRSMVEVSGGGFSYIAGGEAVREVVSSAFRSQLQAKDKKV